MCGRKLSPAFTPDEFFGIAPQFYGKRFAGRQSRLSVARLDIAARDVV
jgi:hypothetical protein